MSGAPKKAQDVVNTFGVALIGITSAVLLWVSVIALQAYYRSTADAVELDRKERNNEKEVRELKAAQLAGLHEMKWVDQKKGIVSIPIEDAMAKVVADAAGGAPSLVPAIGPHDLPTVPARPGRPVDALPGATAPGTPAPGAMTPAPTTPAPGATPPAPGATPAPTATPTAPAPAAHP